VGFDFVLAPSLIGFAQLLFLLLLAKESRNKAV
jgi:hypothetical protein